MDNDIKQAKKTKFMGWAKDWIPIFSILVGVAAIVFAAWSALIIRHHNHLSVQPAIRFQFDVDKTAPCCGGLYITNHGLGPAFIEKMTIQGHECSYEKRGEVIKCLSPIFCKSRYKDFCKYIRFGDCGKNSILNNEKSYNLITIDRPEDIDEESLHRLLYMLEKDIDDLRIKISYRCLYNRYYASQVWPPGS